MNWKKGIILIALIMMTATCFAALPEVSQLNYTPSPAVPGTTITGIVQIENLDSATQKGVTIKIDNDYPFTVKTTETETNPRNIGNMEKYGKALANFTIYIDPTAENKTYYLPITITTEGDKAGKKVSMAVIISGKEPLIKVIGTSEEKLLPGEEKLINLEIQNIGTSPAYDIIVGMQEDRTVIATTGTVVERDITPLGAAAAYLPGIKPGEKKTVQLKVSVSNTATIKNYTLPITSSYRNASGTRTTDTSYIGLKVYSNAELDATIKENTGSEITVELFNRGLGKAEFTLVEMEGGEIQLDKPKQFIGSLNSNDVDTAKTGITFTGTGEKTLNVKITYQDADSTVKTKNIALKITPKTTTQEGPNLLLILIIIAVIGIVIWNFFIRKKKK